MPRHGWYFDQGDHECLSEDWLVDNLPKGWTYDCQIFTEQDGFVIESHGHDGTLFIPLDLLKRARNE